MQSENNNGAGDRVAQQSEATLRRRLRLATLGRRPACDDGKEAALVIGELENRRRPARRDA